jgi:lipoate-protein ligase A
MRARLLDLGMVGALRSQSIYHALTDCMTAESDVAISLMRPRETYVSIGYFQEAEREVDLAFCESQGLPVIRRHVGGGAVLLDRQQLFFHVMLPRARAREFGLPATLAERFAYLARPAVEAYRRMGVPAEFRPINDIHVRGRKIGGTGVGEIGDGLVFAGSMMLDFDTALMARVLKIPDAKMRDKVAQTLGDYMTTLTRELGEAPPLKTVAEHLTAAFEQVYGLELVPSLPTPEELDAMYRWDAALADPAWLHAVQLREQPRQEVKIAAHVHVLHAQHKAPGGMLRATVRVVEDRVDEILLSGDFPVAPKSALEDLAERLAGAPISGEELARRLQEAFRSGALETAGVRPDDFGSLFQQLVP